MKFYLECYPCCLNQALKIFGRVDVSLKKKDRLLRRLMKKMADMPPASTPPHVAGLIYREIRETFIKKGDIFDPYSQEKKDSNAAALDFNDETRALIKTAPDPLLKALAVAAGGNIIDLGVARHGDLDVRAEIVKLLKTEFTVEETEPFREMAAGAKQLLYILDNAGEIVFDRILIETLLELFPQLDITASVRGAPVLNDALMADARDVGLDRVCRVISSGCPLPGTDLKMSTKKFRKAFMSADVIISKGQGNYETLSDQGHKNIFYILKVKCPVVARHMELSMGSLVFKSQ